MHLFVVVHWRIALYSIDFFAWDDQLRLAAFFVIDTPFAVLMKCWYFWSVS